MSSRLLRTTLAAALLSTSALGVSAASAASTTAVPAGKAGFSDSATCEAKFVRSASGIINETERTGCSPVNGVQDGVVVQFRPTIGKVPNSACATNVIAAPFTLTGSQITAGSPQLDAWFVADQVYNVCFYLADNQVATGSVDSADADGTSVPLPLAGRYRVDVAGTWQNTTFHSTDAEYLTWPDGAVEDGLLAPRGFHVDPDFGDLLVNDTAIAWGPADAAHNYTTTVTGSALKLNVNDTSHSDNVGSLTYTVTYLGLS